MKTVILAGGFGTRLSEYTESIPKPMVSIGGKPIIEHIMMIYSKFGFNEFIVALGYKGEIIKKFFDQKKYNKWKIHLVDTGAETLTGGRVKRLKKYLEKETFFLTYGDGVSDVNMNDLLKFHNKHKKIATVTAVRPPARFGSLTLDNNTVVSFKEKIESGENWINGGFFVMEPEIFDFLDNDQTILEKDPLENLSKQKELMAYLHKGFWQCMDHKVDKVRLDEICKKKNIPWLTN